MAHQTLINVANLCQAVVMPICLSAYVPQWITLLRNRSSEDISLKAEMLWAGGSLLSVFYALVQVLEFGTGYALLFSSLVNLLCLSVTIVLICYYRARPDCLVEPIESAITNNQSSSVVLCRLGSGESGVQDEIPPHAERERISPAS